MNNNKNTYTYDDVYNNTLKWFNGDDLAATVWMSKYCLKDSDKDFNELTPDDMHKRMAKYFAETEERYETNINDDVKNILSSYGRERDKLSEEKIYDLFKDFKYVIPGGSVMSGLGSPIPVSLSNCWVIEGPDDTIDDIFRVCNEQSQLSKRRGGLGFDISKLRPNGASVNNSAKSSTGAVSFMDLFSHVTNTIAQAGRRGALMLSINIKHPDAKEFIEKKQDLTKVTGANISVQIDDEFMKLATSVDNNLYIQRFPIDISDEELFGNNSVEDILDTYELNTLHKGSSKNSYFRIVNAKELWDNVIHCAWNTAEPGIIFQSNHHDYSPDGLYNSFRGSCTNPCVIGDTTLLTKGGFVKIKDVVGKEIEIWNGKEWTLLTPFKTSDNEKVYKVKFSNELELICTKYHKFILQGDVRKELNDCVIGDKLEYFIYPLIDECKEYTKKLTDKPIEIIGIEYYGEEATYCVNDPLNHSALFNGIMTAQCGEIFMHEDSCRLIHLNLTSFIDNPFTENASLDEDKLYKISYEAMCLGDDLVDLEAKAIDKILTKIVNDGDTGNNEYNLYQRLLKHSLEGRRCGLGFTGLADTIAMLGLKYDSDESLAMIERIMKLMFTAQLDSQIDMAITRGKFEAQDLELEKKGNRWYDFVKDNFTELYERMMKYGRRNISFSTVAPTGTVSLMAKCSSGIEPIFLPFYTRRKKCMTEDDRVDFVDQVGEKYTEFVVVHPTLKEWAKVNCHELINKDIDSWNENDWNHVYKHSPWNGSTANDINWEKRVELQGIVQKYITHSISSTVNLPNSATEEEVSNIYIKSWANQLKGITCYRDGCRSGVLVSTDKKEEETKGEDTVCINNEPVSKRPKEIPCKIFRFSNKGEKWIGVVGLVDNKPYEIFTGILEKLNIPNWVEDGFIVRNKEKKVIDGEEKLVSRYDICYIDKDGYRTCIEGLSRTFNPEYWNYAKLISGLLRHRMPLAYIIKVISSLNLDSSTINTWKNGVIRTLKKFNDSNPDEATYDVCPECGGRILKTSGCMQCLDCGYSKCG